MKLKLVTLLLYSTLSSKLSLSGLKYLNGSIPVHCTAYIQHYTRKIY
jgi:hypothetical protein